MSIRKVNEGYLLSLAKIFHAVLLIDKPVLVFRHTTQNESYVFFETDWFVQLRTNFDRLRAEVLWREYKLTEGCHKALRI